MDQSFSVPRTLVCTADGIFIVPGRALVERRGALFFCTSLQEMCNSAGVLYGPEVVYGPLFPTIERAKRFLERGQLAQAQETIAKLKLPPLTPTGENLLRQTSVEWRKEFEPDEHPRWPAGSPDSVGGRFSPKDTGDVQIAQEMLPFFARPEIFARPPVEDEPQFKEPIPRLSGKEGAKDPPSWVRGQRPYVGENGRDFAKRMMDEKYGPGNWNKESPEYGKIQKYGDRNFRDPKAILLPDGNEA